MAEFPLTQQVQALVPQKQAILSAAGELLPVEPGGDTFASTLVKVMAGGQDLGEYRVYVQRDILNWPTVKGTFLRRQEIIPDYQFVARDTSTADDPSSSKMVLLDVEKDVRDPQVERAGRVMAGEHTENGETRPWFGTENFPLPLNGVDLNEYARDLKGLAVHSAIVLETLRHTEWLVRRPMFTDWKRSEEQVAGTVEIPSEMLNGLRRTA